MSESQASSVEHQGVEVRRLEDHPEAVPQIADWWFEQWLVEKGISREAVADEIRRSLAGDDLPIVLGAWCHHGWVGSAVLRDHELEVHYPDLRFWLGSVYVVTESRGLGIASRLVGAIEALARSRGIETLHLQTEAPDGGLYARLGWVPIDRITVDGLKRLVMGKCLV